MRIIEDLNFINESNKYIEDKMGLSKKNIDEAYQAIYSTLSWWKSSPYRKTSENILIYITDIPISGDGAFVGSDEDGTQIMIYLNISSLVSDFEKGKHKLDFFMEEKESCFGYVKFVLLHEIGHIIIASLEIHSEKNVVDRLSAYLCKYNLYYKKLEDEIKKLGIDTQNRYVRKAYRKIPSESRADKFAFMVEDQIKCKEKN